MKRLGWVIMLGVLLAGAAGGFWSGKAEAGEGGDAASVLAFAQAHMEPGSRMTVKWYGQVPAAARAEAELEKFENRLVNRLGFSIQGQVSSEGGHTVFQVQEEGRDGVTASVYVMNGELLLKLEAPGSRMAELLDRREAWERAVAEEKLQGRWIAAAQGWLSGADGYGQEPERMLLKEAGDRLKASPNGRYQEEGTINVTLTSKLLQAKASASDPTALQVALHRATTEGRWMLTIGTPILTGEF